MRLFACKFSVQSEFVDPAQAMFSIPQHRLEKEHNKRDSMAFAAGKAFPESSSKLIYKKIHESLKIQP